MGRERTADPRACVPAQAKVAPPVGRTCSGGVGARVQQRGAPHFHLYIGLPERVTEEDYRALVGRTIRRKKLERAVGKHQARRSCGVLQGEFGDWLLAAWSASVGTDPTSRHRKFGADVAPFFWGDTVGQAAEGNVNWGRIADYLWRESGKWGQKTVPEDFGSAGRAWGRWGVTVKVTEAEVSGRVAMELRRVLWEVFRRRSEEESLQRGRFRKVAKYRGRDGLTVFELEGVGPSLLRWAEGEAARKQRERGPDPDA